MTEFKVGDKVGTDHGEGTIVYIHPVGEARQLVCIQGFDGHTGFVGSNGTYTHPEPNCYWYSSDDLTLIESAWTPQPGELIEVSDSLGNWCERYFFAFDGKHAVCRKFNRSNHFHRYEHGYRQIKKTVQIEIEGVKTEISRESAQALKKALDELEV